ncbi:MAG TPA: hypothetical protein VK427_07945, partial [Kofleriaceae bacterium]|nr:hypothetical protein [Kofleriaceae bacterium]
MTAELTVDNKKLQAVKNGLEIPVSAGRKKIVLTGPDGVRCEKELDLLAGKTTTLACNMAVVPATSAPRTSATSTGSSASTTGSGSATAGSPSSAAAGASAATSTSSAGSADTRAPTGSATAGGVTTGAGSAADGSASSPSSGSASATKASATASSDRGTRDKATRDKVDKVPREKVPVDDNPIDRAASLPSKGFLKIVPPAGAQIMIDSAPPAGSINKLALTPGKHKVMFILGADKHTFSVTVKAGETVTLDKHDLQ